MLKSAIVITLVLTVIVCCTGQTFQYSRGWTNGKRSDAQAGNESNELVLDADWDKKLEKCIYMLQRIAQFPYLKFALMMANRKFAAHHHFGSAGSDDPFGAEPMDTRLKGQVDGLSI